MPGVFAGMYNMSFQGRDHERQAETDAKEYKVGTNLSKEEFDAVRTHAACSFPPSVADALGMRQELLRLEEQEELYKAWGCKTDEEKKKAAAKAKAGR